MTQALPSPTHDVRRYMNVSTHALASKLGYLRWMATIPFTSWAGGRAIARNVDNGVPPVWGAEMAGKRVLIVGTGPSLDRADPALFDTFDTLILINYAIRKRRHRGPEYFFTTDIRAMERHFAEQGAGAFEELGRQHCIFAPVFLDQWFQLTEEGRALFTMLRPDRVGWQVRKVRAGPLRLPLVARRYPVQPHWESFALPAPARALPIMDHTSALTAVLFAAVHGAAEIGLIGCDFSAGRAASIAAIQNDNTPGTFSGARAEFMRIRDMLERHGVPTTNHSWLV